MRLKISTYIIYNHILTSIKSNINFIRSVLISNIKNRLRNEKNQSLTSKLITVKTKPISS